MDLSLYAPLEKGVKIIKGYLALLPLSPGVYRMISRADEVLYVGKAKALQKRVGSYTHVQKLPHRLQLMVSLTARMEFIKTHTEADALLLEANLIKKYKPRFNILLRDDKMFPYIVLKDDHDFPQILKHRGAKTLQGQYFGPFPSAGDVNRTLSVLQRVFLLRNCSDHVLENRQRPCLQYHIKRCSAPCVGKVDKDAYAQQVKGAQDFMQGKSRAVQEGLAQKMQEASDAQEYEAAALYRDRIGALTAIQAKHDMNSAMGDADIITIAQNNGVSCMQVFFYRAGQNLGNKAYFPRHDKDDTPEAILAAFIAQFYQNKAVPKMLVVNQDMADRLILEEALGTAILCPQRGKYKRAVDFAVENACEALKRHQALSATRLKMRTALVDLFDLDDIPKRIEVYDNSHISGTHMVGAMIVEGEAGFLKKAYRKFTIKTAGKADDYGMMREVLTRRFKRSLQEEDEQGGENDFAQSWPDLLLIDGGLGQLRACQEVLEDLGILERLSVVAIAKGIDRNAGREKFFMLDKPMFQLPVHDPVLHYLECLRDEAHRFAIGTHRARRAKAFTASPFDKIEGVGAKRKKALLLHFGSAKAAQSASIDDLCKVDGISRALARKIYDFFHG